MSHALYTTLPRVRSGVRTGRSPLSWLALLFAVRHERARLARLDDHTLADIGISRDEAAREAARPVWDVPGHWRR